MVQAPEKTDLVTKATASRRSRKFSPVAAAIETSEPVTIINNRISNTSNPEDTSEGVTKKERRGRGAFAAYTKNEMKLTPKA